MQSAYDVVVVGSGFGGAITACRLAQAGRSVCLLEQGRWWKKEEFPRSPGQVSRSMVWDPQRATGFIDLQAFRKIDVASGVGVGGGSLHYFNVHMRTPGEIFERGGWPKNTNRARLDPYYDLAREMLDARPLTAPRGRTALARTQAFLEAARKAGGENPHLVDICVHTGEDRVNPHGGEAFQRACEYCGHCLVGCHIHAKNTLDLNYIALARSNGAVVFALHKAEKIEPRGDGYAVHFTRTSEGGRDREPGVVNAGKLIISGGSLGSAELLLKARDVHRTLPALSGALGTRFSANGDYMMAGVKGLKQDVDLGFGVPITAGVFFHTKDNLIQIQDLGAPDGLAWYLEGVIPSAGRIRNIFSYLGAYVLTGLGLNQSGKLDTHVGTLMRDRVTKNMMLYLGMGTDAADGRINLTRNGQVNVDWNSKGSRRMIDETRAAMRKVSEAAGGTFFDSVLWKPPLRKLLTGHPLGGCVMADDPRDGVVNEYGEVWGYPNLYVADSSIIPTALVVNPSATISAVGERVAFHMVHGREMEAGDACAPAEATPSSTRPCRTVVLIP